MRLLAGLSMPDPVAQQMELESTASSPDLPPYNVFELGLDLDHFISFSLPAFLYIQAIYILFQLPEQLQLLN
jgi:hypothetical protein